MDQTKSVMSKLAATLFALVFAVAFSTFGYFGGLSPLLKQVLTWHKAASWQAVDARVLDVKLESYQGETTTFQTQATFEYQWQGQRFRSQQVALEDEGSDNIDDFHQRNYRGLKQAYDQEQTVRVWVDPTHPANAVYSREIRWTKIAFLLPFAILFPLIGLGACWMLFRIWMPESEKIPQHYADQMKAMGFSSHSHHVVLPLSQNIRAWIGFSLFWNLISWPIAVLIFASSASSHWAAILVAIAFPAFGLFIVIKLLRQWRVRQYWGKVFLIAPQTVRIAETSDQFRLVFKTGFAQVSVMGSGEQALLKFHLQYVSEDKRGDDTTENTVLETEIKQERIMRGAAYIDFKLPPLDPEMTTQFEKHPDLHYRWQLQVSAEKNHVVFPMNLLPAATEHHQQVSPARTKKHTTKPTTKSSITSTVDVANIAIETMFKRQRFIRLLIGIPFFGLIAWTVLSELAWPAYRDFRQSQAHSTSHSAQRETINFTRIPFELNSLSGNGFSVLAKAQGYLEVSDNSMRVIPDELVLQSADDCESVCPSIDKVIFELSEEGSTSFHVVSSSSPIFVGGKLHGTQPLKVVIDKNQAQIWLQYKSRAELEKWRLTLSIHGRIEGNQASWYVHAKPF